MENPTNSSQLKDRPYSTYQTALSLMQKEAYSNEDSGLYLPNQT